MNSEKLFQSMKRDEEKNKDKSWSKFANSSARGIYKYSGMGTKMAVIILAGAYSGVKLDEYIQIGFPLFTILLSLAGVAVAIYIVIKDVT